MNNKGELNRRGFLKSCAGASVAFLFLSNPVTKQSYAKRQKRPNVVLVVADDHGLDAVGCYGNKVIRTPNMDRLASEGTRFTHAFCTTASCSASRSVILTGQHNHTNGQYGHQHSYSHFSSYKNIKSLPVILSETGYRTARVGKYHVAPESVYKFDTVIKAHGRNPVEMANKCKTFINSSDKPFFLYFCTNDPHRSLPYKSDLPYGPNLFGNLAKGYPGVTAVEYNPEHVIIPSFLPDTPQSRAELAQYYQSVYRVDQGLGRLFKILESADKYDDTLIIYISDNGIAFNGAKTTLYEPGMHLPCIVRSPYQKRKGVACNAMVTWADITPTILDFCGAMPAKTDFHGRSFLSVIEHENCQGWDEIYASHTFHEITMYYPMRVIRQRRYKLIYNIAHQLDYPFGVSVWNDSTWEEVINSGRKYYGKRTIDAYIHRPRFELYDLEKDPDEIDNLAYDPKFAELLEKLKVKLRAFQEKTKDPWILKWYYERDVLGKSG